MTTPEPTEITAPLPITVGRLPVRPAESVPAPQAGAMVVGRYRLIALQGTEPHLQFWRAVDTATGRPVGLTLIDVAGELPAERVHEILSRTVRLRGLDVAGIAAVFEVRHAGDCGIVVSEWVPGGSLREVADTAPYPTAVAAVMESLIVAADVAHRAETALSIVSPGRIRISSDGQAVLAFPASLPETTPRDDLHGIGGALYAMLVNRWPAQDPMPHGWSPVEVDDVGWPKEPAAIDDKIPFLVSSAAAGLVRPQGGVDSAATLLSMLRQARRDAEKPDTSTPLALPVRDLRADGYAAFRSADPAQRVTEVKRQVMKTILVAAAAIAIIALTSLGSSLNGLLGDDDAPAMDAAGLGLTPGTTQAPAPPAPDVVRQTAAATPVVPARVDVFSPDGSPDNPNDAGRAIDRDPATAWTTDRYYDADPFPKFKQGLGLLLTLAQPTPLDSVAVDVKGTGTVVQIRSAAGDPKKLEDTAELSAPALMQPGPNRVAVTAGPPVTKVLVWISTLGSTDGANRAEITEVTLTTRARA